MVCGEVGKQFNFIYQRMYKTLIARKLLYNERSKVENGFRFMLNRRTP